jgi:xanthine dehydrogenase accessory factor
MLVLIRGGGDLASGVALRLHRVGMQVVISELPQPLAVRRKVSFAEAIYTGVTEVEGVTAQKVEDPADSSSVWQILSQGHIPVIVDPEVKACAWLQPPVVVDGRMQKRAQESMPNTMKLFIGLGPGFVAGENCHVVIETNRGHMLGRVIREGSPEADTGIPDRVGDKLEERVLRAPVDGILHVHVEIGDHLQDGDLVAEIEGQSIRAPFRGVLRGLLYPGVKVRAGVKIGDVDPRDVVRYCMMVSDKSLAIGGGVLEAILSLPELRKLYLDTSSQSVRRGLDQSSGPAINL